MFTSLAIVLEHDQKGAMEALREGKTILTYHSLILERLTSQSRRCKDYPQRSLHVVGRSIRYEAISVLRQDCKEGNMGRYVVISQSPSREYRAYTHSLYQSGAIELAILSDKYKTEIISIDVQTGRADRKQLQPLLPRHAGQRHS